MKKEDLHIDASSEFDYSKVDAAVKHIVENHHPTKIILFGSASRHEAHAGSDIDLLIVMDTVKRIKEQEAEIYLSMPSIGAPVEILVITPEELDRQCRNPYSAIHSIVEEGTTVYDSDSGRNEDEELVRLAADIPEAGYHDEKGRLILPKDEYYKD